MSSALFRAYLGPIVLFGPKDTLGNKEIKKIQHMPKWTLPFFLLRSWPVPSVLRLPSSKAITATCAFSVPVLPIGPPIKHLVAKFPQMDPGAPTNGLGLGTFGPRDKANLDLGHGSWNVECGHASWNREGGHASCNLDQAHGS